MSALVLLAATGATVGTRVAAARELSEAQSAFAAAEGDLISARTQLSAAWWDGQLVSGLSTQVDDPKVFAEFAAALDLTEIDAEAANVLVPDSGDVAELRAGTVAAQDLAGRMRDATSGITATKSAVRASHGVWLLAQARADYDAAVGELSAAIAEGEAVLLASDSRVADNAVRSGLREELDRAIAIRDNGLGGDTTADELSAAAAAARAQADALAGPRQSVLDAQASWETLKAQADAAAAQQKKSGGGSGKTTGTNSGSDSRSGGTRGGGSSTTPQVTSPSRPSFGTGAAPECTTPSCGIVF